MLCAPARPARACSNPQQQLRACYRLIAKMPTLAAMAYKTSIGQVRAGPGAS